MTIGINLYIPVILCSSRLFRIIQVKNYFLLWFYALFLVFMTPALFRPQKIFGSKIKEEFRIRILIKTSKYCQYVNVTTVLKETCANLWAVP